MSEQRTVIVVTHRPAILASVDKMLVMSFGSTLAFGPRDEVIAKMRGNKLAVVSDKSGPVALRHHGA